MKSTIGSYVLRVMYTVACQRTDVVRSDDDVGIRRHLSMALNAHEVPTKKLNNYKLCGMTCSLRSNCNGQLYKMPLTKT